MVNLIHKGYISFYGTFFHVHIKNIKGYHEFKRIDIYQIATRATSNENS